MHYWLLLHVFIGFQLICSNLKQIFPLCVGELFRTSHVGRTRDGQGGFCEAAD